ncbi:hypothetical protein [Caulobacter sp.]|uniref:hypothetical protein n=1 Tax=Caulobacter sp. TaxID=78 RepID=UPI001B079368|nr:hypothetical protein [Caulobacter sp.]MBO9543333.1 hypothetical protein [Caulobacter sp.]
MKKAMLALAGALLLATSGQAAERLSPWVSAWSTGLVSSETEKPPTWPEGPFVIREVVRLTAGGPRVRLRLSNAFGTAPLRIDAAHVALSAAPASAAIVAGSDRKVTFDGREAVVIPAGAVWLPDPVTLPVKALDRLAVSLTLPAALRASGAFDAVVDLDAITRDPANPSRLKAEYDSGDLLHPSPAGYRAMAAAIPLAVLK